MREYDLDITATVEQLAILQFRLRRRGVLSAAERRERAQHLRVLDRMQPQVAQILELQIQAGSQSVLTVNDNGEVRLWPDHKSVEGGDPARVLRHWRINPENLHLLLPAAEGGDV